MSTSSKGTIQITDAALASLIGLSAHEVPGVAAMAPVNIKEGITKALGRSQSKDGVVIGHDGDRTTADLSIIVAYGVNIPTVAQNIEDRVRHVVKHQAGLNLSRVRVNVVGVSRD